MGSSLFGGLREKFDKMMEARRQAALDKNPLAKMMRERPARNKAQFMRVIADMMPTPDDFDGVAARVQNAAKSALAVADTFEGQEELKAAMHGSRIAKLAQTSDFETQYKIVLRCPPQPENIEGTRDIAVILSTQDATVMPHFMVMALASDFRRSHHSPEDRMGGARFQALFPFGSFEYENLLAFLHALKKDTQEFESMMNIFRAQSFSGQL